MGKAGLYLLHQVQGLADRQDKERTLQWWRPMLERSRRPAAEDRWRSKSLPDCSAPLGFSGSVHLIHC